ncbi:hypothetical protein [Streptacidiphilus sp. EB129]|uniref:hypothetical protein n=1 Tax=Streptacidiphilus sp. EB129 TaxID=3156262 RepID=UPI00351550C4
MTSEEQPAKVHVDLARHPLWTRTEDLLVAYEQTSDPKEARRLAWINALARDNILRTSRLGGWVF